MATSADDIAKIIDKANELLGKVKQNAIRKDQILERQAAGQEAQAKNPDKFDAKKSLYGEGGKETDFARVKGTDMDDKFPSVPLETLDDNQLALFGQRNGQTPEWDDSRQMLVNRDELMDAIKAAQKAKTAATEGKGKKFAAMTEGRTGIGESSPHAMSPRSRDDVDLSDREAAGVGVSDDTLPFLEGMLANMLDEKNDWVAAARDLEMPLKAGISGTTRRWMHAGNQLGANLPGARLTMLAHLLPTNAHSFHEIMTAAKGIVPYKGKGSYLPIKPLSDGEVRDFAKEAGIASKDEQNQVLGVDNGK